MRHACFLKNLCFFFLPQKSFYLASKKLHSDSPPPPLLHLALKKNSYLYAELMFKLISPLTTLWGFKAPDRGVSLCGGPADDAQRGTAVPYPGAKHPHLAYPPPPASRHTASWRRLRARSLGNSTRDAPQAGRLASPSKACPGAKPRRWQREGHRKGRGIGFVKARELLKRPVALGEFLPYGKRA